MAQPLPQSAMGHTTGWSGCSPSVPCATGAPHHATCQGIGHSVWANVLGQRAGQHLQICQKTSRLVQLFTQDAQEDISIFKRSASAVARQIYVHGTLMTLLFAISEEAQSVKTFFASLGAILARSCLVHAIQRKPAFSILSLRPSCFNLNAACINFTSAWLPS